MPPLNESIAMTEADSLNSSAMEAANTLPASETKEGSKFWRTLEEWSGDANFDEMVTREFPRFAAEFTDPISRRKFLTLMGASLALAGMTGCRQPSGTIVPQVKDNGMLSGVPLHFASAFPLSGYGTGVLARSYEGRPIKVEGNPEHPNSKGGTDIYAQASLLSMYDPDRSWTPDKAGTTTTWPDANQFFLSELARLGDGKGVRILTETITSPTLASQLETFLKKYPKAVWHEYEPLMSDEVYNGTKAAFDKPVQPVYDFSKADVVVSFDADFLGAGPGMPVYARQFSARRSAEEPHSENPSKAMNRLYSVECMQTVTGTKADHRLPVRVSEIPQYVTALAAKLGVPGANQASDDAAKKWAAVVADDLIKRQDPWVSEKAARSKGSTLVVAGDHLPAGVHTLVALINHHLGNVGSTVQYVDPIAARRPLDKGRSLADLCAALDKNEVEFLIILEGNPVYNAPSDLQKSLREGLKKIKTSVHLTQYADETSFQCIYRLPAAHWLETWGDIKGHDGTITIQQPLIAPLYDGHSAIEFMAELLEDSVRQGYEVVRRYWTEQHKANSAYQAQGSFEKFWRKSVHDGWVAGSAAKAVPVQPKAGAAAIDFGKPAAAGRDNFELVFRPDESIYDGRFANNGWLMELPKPLSKITWDNAVYMNYNTAKELKVQLRKGYSYGYTKKGGKDGKGEVEEYVAPVKDFGVTGGEHGRAIAEVYRLQIDQPGGKVELAMPVFILPGIPDNALVVQLGYGRTRAGRVGGNKGKTDDTPTVMLSNGKQGDIVGFNTYRLRTSKNPWVVNGVKAQRENKDHILACTQAHHSMEGRDPIKVGTVVANKETPHWAASAHGAGHGGHGDHDHKDHGHKDHDHKEGHDKEAHKDHDHKGDHSKVGLAVVPKDTLLNNPRGYKYTGTHKWGMVIDLTSCTGCNACVVACQAENNIPVVGKFEVSRGREMHWIRVDRYYTGSPSNPAEVKAHFQPIPCMQCENAPCEQVCPVAATVHSYDGLNDMVYNRCVGTRYCSNNCPYKVRRFNFLQYTDYTTPSLKLLNNPEVTVRTRGVMEKCTYCVQRIRTAEITAQKQAVRSIDRKDSKYVGIALPQEIEDHDGKTPEGKLRVQIPDGAVKSACQQACPAGAITFGDMNDPKSAIHKLLFDSKRKALNYSLLEELNTNPRTTYLAALKNPNPAYENAFEKTKG